MTTEQIKRHEQPRDWATDYDIFDPDYVRDPYPIWDELREKCPVAHTEHLGGSWMPTKYADLYTIAQDIDHFSSREILVAPGQVAVAVAHVGAQAGLQREGACHVLGDLDVERAEVGRRGRHQAHAVARLEALWPDDRG